MSFACRPGTADRMIFMGVSRLNEYRLPDTLESSDIVIDIGMHIGSFSYACLQRGSHLVYGFEADHVNYNLAVSNLKRFGPYASLYAKAVWRSDRRGEKLFFEPSTRGRNTGGGTVFGRESGGAPVETAAFDDIISEVTNGGQKRVRLVKLDCEGSEFPILLTSEKLGLVDCICGEYHELGSSIPEMARVDGVDRFTSAELVRFLERSGFYVESFSHSPGEPLGLFFATRGPNRFFESSREALLLYGRLKREAMRILEECQREGIRRVVLYGAGDAGELIVLAGQELNVKIVGLVDGDPRKHGKKIGAFVVSEPSAIQTFHPEAVIITSFTHADEIHDSLKYLEKSGVRIIQL